jgi:hypothetical protein
MIAAVAWMSWVTRIAVSRMTGVTVARVALGRVPARGTAVGAGKRRQGKGED